MRGKWLCSLGLGYEVETQSIAKSQERGGYLLSIDTLWGRGAVLESWPYKGDNPTRLHAYMRGSRATQSPAQEEAWRRGPLVPWLVRAEGGGLL